MEQEKNGQVPEKKGILVRFARRVYNSMARESMDELRARIGKLEKKVSALNDQVKQSSDRLEKRVVRAEAAANKRVAQAEAAVNRRVDAGVRDLSARVDGTAVLAAERSGGLAAPAAPGEKLRLGILLQDPEDWYRTDSLWQTLKADARFEPAVYAAPKKQTGLSAAEVLRAEGVPFREAGRYTLLEDRPDILIVLSADDRLDREEYLWTDKVSQLGVRIAYLPGSPETMARPLREDRPETGGLQARPWRQFALTEQARFDHICFSPRGAGHVAAVGHPCFDALARRDRYPLEAAVREKIRDRRIVYVDLCAPERAPDGGIAGADIRGYREFFARASEYEEFFFLVRPDASYGAYYEKNGLGGEVSALRKTLETAENAWLCAGDYRPCLYAAAYVIGDRSARLLEAAALDVPVLVMRNFYDREELLPSVRPVFDSFYQGTEAYDMGAFLDFVGRRGNDYKQAERRRAAAEYLPRPDGRSGGRIAEILAQAVYEEAREHA